MADPTGTSGLTAAQHSDLALATQGGPKFMARLQQLADATDKYEQAFAKFRVGQDIAAALEQSRVKLATATATEKAAQEVLARARGEAAALVANTQKAAVDVVEEAAAKKALAEEAAAKVTADADVYAKRVKGDVDGALAAAKDASRQAKDAEKTAIAVTMAAEAAKQQHDKMAAAQAIAAAEFERRTKILSEAVAAALT